MKLIRWRGQLIVDGYVTRMRRLLAAHTDPVPQSPVPDAPDNTDSAKRKAPTVHHTPDDSLVLALLEQALVEGPQSQLVYVSPRLSEPFPIGFGLPVPRSVEKWIGVEEGSA